MQALPDIQSFDVVSEELNRAVQIFDRELQSDLPFVVRLVEHVRHYRGKLLRPRLVLLSGAATGPIRHEHHVLAAVVEMVHMATLVHDDVLDEAEVRRRSATVNRLIGNEGAVLLGDFLISHAYHLCSSLGSTRFSRRIAEVTNTVCEGELMQIHHRGNTDLREDEYLEIIRRKTAALTGVCCELGAEASGAGRPVVRALSEFGLHLGMAFQIVDDLLDLTGSVGETGKSVGRDAEMGKLTLPAIRCLRSAEGDQRRRLIEQLTGPSPDRHASLRENLTESGAVESAMDTARLHADSAVASLSDLPPSAAKDALIAAAEFTVQRRK